MTIRTHFAFDSAELTAEDKAELERVAARLKELEFVGGTATGHTDSVGDEAYNQKLSERRAQAVVDFLPAKGVARAASRRSAWARPSRWPTMRPKRVVRRTVA